MGTFNFSLEKLEDLDILEAFKHAIFMEKFFRDKQRPEMALFFKELKQLLFDEIVLRDLSGVCSLGAQPVEFESLDVLSDAELSTMAGEFMKWGTSAFRQLTIAVLDEMRRRNAESLA